MNTFFSGGGEDYHGLLTTSDDEKVISDISNDGTHFFSQDILQVVPKIVL